jgi:hypothetical protein
MDDLVPSALWAPMPWFVRPARLSMPKPIPHRSRKERRESISEDVRAGWRMIRAVFKLITKRLRHDNPGTLICLEGSLPFREGADVRDFS